MPLNLSLIILAATQPGKCVFNSSSDASGGNLPTNIVADKDPWTASEKPKSDNRNTIGEMEQKTLQFKCLLSITHPPYIKITSP